MSKPFLPSGSLNMRLHVTIENDGKPTSKLVINCEEGTQRVKWLGLIASQRLQNVKPSGARRRREQRRIVGGFHVPGAVRNDGGVIMNPNAIINEVFKDGDTVVIEMMATWAGRGAAGAWQPKMEVNSQGGPAFSQYHQLAHMNSEAELQTRESNNGTNKWFMTDEAQQLQKLRPSLSTSTSLRRGSPARLPSLSRSDSLTPGAMPGYRRPGPKFEPDANMQRVKVLTQKRKAAQFIYIMEGQMLFRNVFGLMSEAEVDAEVDSVVSAAFKKMDLVRIFPEEEQHEKCRAVVHKRFPMVLCLFKHYSGHGGAGSCSSISFSEFMHLLDDCKFSIPSVLNFNALKDTLVKVHFREAIKEQDKRKRKEIMDRRVRTVLHESEFELQEYMEALLFLCALKYKEAADSSCLELLLDDIASHIPAKISRSEDLLVQSLADAQVQCVFQDGLPHLMRVYRHFSETEDDRLPDSSKGQVARQAMELDSFWKMVCWLWKGGEVVNHDNYDAEGHKLHHPHSPGGHHAHSHQDDATPGTACEGVKEVLALHDVRVAFSAAQSDLDASQASGNRALVYSEWVEALLRILIAEQQNVAAELRKQQWAEATDGAPPPGEAPSVEVATIKRRLDSFLLSVESMSKLIPQRPNQLVEVNRRGSSFAV
jgi:hypothetical protein